jgi:O-antigen ligase
MNRRSLLIATVFLIVSFSAFGLSYLVLHSTKMAIILFAGVVALTVFFIEPFVGLVNYFLFLYVRPHEFVTALIGMPVMLLIGAATAALMLMRMIINKRPGLYSRAPQNWLVVWFLIATTVSHLSYLYMEGAVSAARGFGTVVIMYLLIANGVTTEKKLKFTIHFLAALTVALAVQGIVQYFTGRGFGGVEMYDGQRIQAVGIFEDPNDLAMAMVMVLPVFFFVATQSTSAIARVVAVAGILILVFALFLTDSRGGLLSFGVVSLMLFARKYGWLPGIVVGVFMTAAMFVLSERMATISTEEGSAHGRIEAWAAGLDMFESRPLFGIGEGNFTEYHFRTAHNSFVLCAAELGLLGLVPWVMILYVSIKNVVFIGRELRERGQTALAMYVDTVRYALIAYISAGVFLSRTYSELLFIMVGLTAAITHMFVKQSTEKYVLVERRDFVVSLVISVGGYMFFKSFLYWAW